MNIGLESIIRSDNVSLLPSINISDKETKDTLLSYLPLVYELGLSNFLSYLIDTYSLSWNFLYSDEYRQKCEASSDIKLSPELVKLCVAKLGHSQTNMLLTTMKVYRTSSAVILLPIVGGFIPDLVYTLNSDGPALHDSFYLYLEEDDQKYRAEFLEQIQDLPRFVLSRLYASVDILIDVTLATQDTDDGVLLVSTTNYSNAFLEYLLFLQPNPEQLHKLIIWMKANRTPKELERYAELYPYLVSAI